MVYLKWLKLTLMALLFPTSRAIQAYVQVNAVHPCQRVRFKLGARTSPAVRRTHVCKPLGDQAEVELYSTDTGEMKL